MSPKLTPKMQQNQRRNFRSRQDFSRHNENEFVCEFANNGTFTTGELAAALQDFFKENSGIHDGMTSNQSDSQSENALKIMLGLALVFRNKQKFE